MAATAIRPPMIEVVLAQASADATVPGATRPEATAPMAAPRKNGVSREETANTAP